MDGLGITIDGFVNRIIDGDTIEVEIKKTFRVRLLDCWAPELKEKGGSDSRRFLARAAVGKRVSVSIPLEAEQKFGDSMSFQRVLARVKLENGTDLSELMVASGHAEKERPSK